MKRILLCTLVVALVLGLAAFLVSRDIWPASAPVSAAKPAQTVPAATARPLVIVTASPEPVHTAQPSPGGSGHNG